MMDSKTTHQKPIPDLDAHMLEPRYPCTLYGLHFIRSNDVVRHVATIHNKLQYPCGLCDRTYNRLDARQSHLCRIHLTTLPIEVTTLVPPVFKQPDVNTPLTNPDTPSTSTTGSPTTSTDMLVNTTTSTPGSPTTLPSSTSTTNRSITLAIPTIPLI